MDKKGNPSPARLFVRLTQDSTSAVAGNAMEQAQTSAQKLLRPLVSDVSNACTNISDTLSNQQNLVTSFQGLMERLEPLVKIGDEVAKVCSSASSLLNDLNSSFFQIDPSLCQFCVESAFRRNEGELNSIILVLFLIYMYSIRWCKPNRLETGRF